MLWKAFKLRHSTFKWYSNNLIKEWRQKKVNCRYMTVTKGSQLFSVCLSWILKLFCTAVTAQYFCRYYQVGDALICYWPKIFETLWVLYCVFDYHILESLCRQCDTMIPFMVCHLYQNNSWWCLSLLKMCLWLMILCYVVRPQSRSASVILTCWWITSK